MDPTFLTSGGTDLRIRSHFAHVALALSLLAAFGVPLPGQPEAEDALKGAALLAFVQNVYWAGQAAGDAPITVGVVGRKAFLRQLRSIMEGRLVEGRPLRILALTAPVDPHCCQVLYFATDKPGEIAPVLQSLNSAHVLTVGETDRFLEQGGAVNLFLSDGHMAFEVSLEALDRSGMEISSKLLRFGQIRDLTKGRRK